MGGYGRKRLNEKERLKKYELQRKMSIECRCGMVDCPNSNHIPTYVHKYNSNSKVFCKEYFSTQHNPLVNGAVYISNMYPSFVESPNFQFHYNGLANVRRGKPSANYDPRKLHSNMGGSNRSQFNDARGWSARFLQKKRKKVKFWGDSENLMDPPPQKIAYYKLGSRPSDMTVLSFN